jgi:hypothetical protein
MWRATFCAAVLMAFLPRVGTAGSGSRVPNPTRSWYVRSTDSAVLAAAGCTTAQTVRGAADGERFAVVLVFGGISAGAGDDWVLDLYREAAAPVTDVTAAVREYIGGYERCGSETARAPLTLVIGTTTSRGTISRGAGAGFAGVVDGIVRAVGERPGITILGGNDIELGYVRPATARAWADGYHGATERLLVNYGDLAGCPGDRVPRAGDCGTAEHPEWSVEDVWHIAGHPNTVNFPTIYVTNGIQARQWRNLSRYGVQRHGRPLRFLGTLSQIAACEVRPCSRRARNTPAAAWHQLRSLLAADPALDAELAASDIAWMAAPPGTTDDDQLAGAEPTERPN